MPRGKLMAKLIQQCSVGGAFGGKRSSQRPEAHSQPRSDTGRARLAASKQLLERGPDTVRDGCRGRMASNAIFCVTIGTSASGSSRREASTPDAARRGLGSWPSARRPEITGRNARAVRLGATRGMARSGSILRNRDQRDIEDQRRVWRNLRASPGAAVGQV